MKKSLIITAITLPLALFLSFWVFGHSVAGALSYQKDINPETVTGEYDTHPLSAATFNNDPVDVPLADTGPTSNVLGHSNSSKRIEVDLTHQRLYAYENGNMVYSFLISSGKWGRTPTGTFKIWTKLRYTKMEGGSKALHTYYYLPNVPYTMFFYNDQVPKHRGYALHGTYWHSNFGHPMSHGCVNMKTEEAELIFYWAQPDLQGKRSVFADEENQGTDIVIYGEAPWD